MLFASPEARGMKVIVAGAQSDVGCELLIDAAPGAKPSGRTTHSRGTVVLGSSGLPAIMPIGQPTFGWIPFAYPDAESIWHGPSLRAFRNLSFLDAAGWAELIAPAKSELSGTRPSEGWRLAVSLMDGCLVACGTYTYFMMNQRLEIPQGIERLQVGREPRAGERCLMHFDVLRQDARDTWFDFVVVGEDYAPLFVATSYRTVLLRGA
ncbi:MAG TPA: hypothetical protein VHZ24_06465 [Pirellulales bacterium]|jgi:hypothetical protein|nr:hypothetical protein [Pirellulales bacterium]